MASITDSFIDEYRQKLNAIRTLHGLQVDERHLTLPFSSPVYVDPTGCDADSDAPLFEDDETDLLANIAADTSGVVANRHESSQWFKDAVSGVTYRYAVLADQDGWDGKNGAGSDPKCREVTLEELLHEQIAAWAGGPTPAAENSESSRLGIPFEGHVEDVNDSFGVRFGKHAICDASGEGNMMPRRCLVRNDSSTRYRL